MRILGVLLVLAGTAGTAGSIQQSFSRGRAASAIFGLLAPLCVLAALAGALLCFIPDFFS